MNKTSEMIMRESNDVATLNTIITAMGTYIYDLDLRKKLWDIRIELIKAKNEKEKIVIALVK